MPPSTTNKVSRPGKPRYKKGRYPVPADPSESDDTSEGTVDASTRGNNSGEFNFLAPLRGTPAQLPVLVSSGTCQFSTTLHYDTWDDAVRETSDYGRRVREAMPDDIRARFADGPELQFGLYFTYRKIPTGPGFELDPDNPPTLRGFPDGTTPLPC